MKADFLPLRCAALTGIVGCHSMPIHTISPELDACHHLPTQLLYIVAVKLSSFFYTL